MLDGPTMGDAIVAAIQAVNPEADASFLKTYWEPIATAIVLHIQNNAVVEPGTFTNGGGPVTGTGTVQ